jgi:hypothetical protein
MAYIAYSETQQVTGSTWTIPLPTGQYQSGDRMFISTGSRSSGTVTAINNGWTPLGTPAFTNGCVQAWAYKNVGNSETDPTMTVAGTNSGIAVIIVVRGASAPPRR